MKYTITVPYPGADTQYYLWGHEEDDIDFRLDKARADRCTICFAACELETYLKKIGLEVSVSDQADDNYQIALTMTENAEGEEYHKSYLSEIRYEVSKIEALPFCLS